MPSLAPIQGNLSVRVGLNTTLTCATVGGSWSSSDTGKATVVASTGVVTGVAQGLSNIIYTVDSDSIMVTLTVTIRSLSNGFDIDAVYTALKERVKWKSLGYASQSMRYFEDFHTLCTTEILRDLQPNATITDDSMALYLNDLARTAIFETVNAIYNAPAIIDPAKLCFYRGDWVLYPQPVANTGQFVGLKMIVAKGDYAIRFNSLELFFDKDCTFNMYLYNDMVLPPIYTLSVSALAGQQATVYLSNDAILNYLTPNINKGGTVYWGYYQADVEAQGAHAMYYSIANEQFKPCRIWAFGAPQTGEGDNRNFQRNNIGSNNLTYGLNVEVTTFNDGTNNIVQNAHLFDEAIGLSVAAKVIEAIIFSYRSNSTERNIQGLPSVETLYNELNLVRPSDDLPFSVGLKKQIERAIVQAKKSFQDNPARLIGTS